MACFNQACFSPQPTHKPAPDRNSVDAARQGSTLHGVQAFYERIHRASSAALTPALAVLRAHIDTRPGARARTLLVLRAVDEALLDVGRKGVKCLIDVDVALGGNLEEGNAELVGELLALLGGNNTLLFPVALVTDEDLVDALGGVLLDVGKPGTDVYPVGVRRLAYGPDEGGK